MLLTVIISAAVVVQTPGPELYPRVRLDAHLPARDVARPFEEARAFVAANGSDPLPWTPAQVEITAGEDMSRSSLSIAFNWVWLTDAEGRRPVWFARLRAMDWNGTVERFADARECPAVLTSLERLDQLPAIEPRIPGLPRPDAPPDLTDLGVGYLHDNGYRLRARGLFAGERYSQKMEISGGSESPLAPAVVETLQALRPCWNATPPPSA